MMAEISWRYAWVTGAGKGIGRALAIHLCQQGVHVYGSSRTLADLESLANEVEGEVGGFTPCALDITDEQGIYDLVARFGDDLAVPDLVVLNAGTHQALSVFDTQPDDVKRLMAVNFHGTVNCLLACLGLVKRMGLVLGSRELACLPQIAVVSSVAGYRGLRTAGSYGASKAALINFCEAIKPELDEYKVKLQLINPGFVRTPLTDQNDFEMPCLVEAEDAATAIVRGLRSNQFEISFPTGFVMIMKLLRLLPYRIFFPLISRITASK